MNGDRANRGNDLLVKSKIFAFVGSQTTGKGAGITIFPYDEIKGEFGAGRLICDTGNPTFLAIDPVNSMLYAVQELDNFGGSSGGGLAAYVISSGNNGSLEARQISVQRSLGAYPCHVALEPEGRTLYVSNYGDGVLTVYPLDSKGWPGPAIQEFRYIGHGIKSPRQECSHVHSVAVAPSGRFLLVADLGRDVIIRYSISARTGALVVESAQELHVAPGSGPRHFAFHPNGGFVYVVEELSSEITAFQWEGETGSLRGIGTVSTLPDLFRGENLAADVHIHPNGHFLYCSNRGHDSIAHYELSTDSGELRLLGHTHCGGLWPRNFAIDPAGSFLFVTNSKSDSIARFLIDPSTGNLNLIDSTTKIGEPMCIVFSSVHGDW
jgi:6-phosphogluconolactonase